jgi:hypothetical protein
MVYRTLHTGSTVAAGPVRRGIAVLVLGFQLAGILVGVGHAHVIALRLTADPALETHECGAHERHIPLDSIHHCPLCQQLYRLWLTPENDIVATVLLVPLSRFHEATLPVVVDGDYPFPQKRGPPAAI